MNSNSVVDFEKDHPLTVAQQRQNPSIDNRTPHTQATYGVDPGKAKVRNEEIQGSFSQTMGAKAFHKDMAASDFEVLRKFAVVAAVCVSLALAIFYAGFKLRDSMLIDPISNQSPVIIETVDNPIDAEDEINDFNPDSGG